MSLKDHILVCQAANTRLCELLAAAVPYIEGSMNMTNIDTREAAAALLEKIRVELSRS